MYDFGPLHPYFPRLVEMRIESHIVGLPLSSCPPPRSLFRELAQHVDLVLLTKLG